MGGSVIKTVNLYEVLSPYPGEFTTVRILRGFGLLSTPRPQHESVLGGSAEVSVEENARRYEHLYG